MPYKIYRSVLYSILGALVSLSIPFLAEAQLSLLPAQIIGNKDPGFSTIGTWQRITGVGYQGSELLASSTGSVATWRFTNLPQGTYRVSDTWTASSKLTPYAKLTVSSTGSAGAIVTMQDQRYAPRDLSAADTMWADLGYYTVTGSDLKVTLQGWSGYGVWDAEAVRIEKVR